MQKIRKAVVILLCLVFFTTNAAVASAADVPSAWAQDEVNAAIVEGLVPEELQEEYTETTTRAEFTALAVALYESIKGEIKGRRTFDDTKDVNVEKAAYIGIVVGVGNDLFAPDSKLTREQAAVMLSRLADKLDKPLPREAPTFADNSQISSWAFESVGHVQAGGIMTGVGNNTFLPKGSYTREQSICTIMRMLNVMKAEEESTEEPEEEPATLTEESVYNAMMAMQAQYPDGMSWTEENYYTSTATGTKRGGGGCTSFALILSDAAFGTLPFRERHSNLEKLRVGDLLYYPTHRVVVLKIEGDTITIAEGNYNSVIRWGRTLSLNDLKQTRGVTVDTRWP